MRYIRHNMYINKNLKSDIDDINFYIRKGHSIVLNDRIDLDKKVELSIVPHYNKAFLLRVTVNIIDKDYEDEIIIKAYTEDTTSFLKVYMLKFEDTVYFIDLSLAKAGDDFLNKYHILCDYNSIIKNLENNIEYFDILIKSKNLNNDLELMKFICTTLQVYNELDDIMIENVKKKLVYFGYNKDDINNDLELDNEKSYLNNALNYLLRKLYNDYNDIDKDTYLENSKDLFESENVESFFGEYIRNLKI